MSAATRCCSGLRTLHQWDWISAALSLAGLLLLAFTGFALSHADAIQAQPRAVHRALQVPVPPLDSVAAA